MTRTSKSKRTNVIIELSNECWCEVIKFFESPDPFLNLVKAVKGLYEYVRNVHPFCTHNICFELRKEPKTKRRMTHVTNLSFSVNLRKKKKSYVPRASQFPNLRTVRISFKGLYKIKKKDKNTPKNSQESEVKKIKDFRTTQIPSFKKLQNLTLSVTQPYFMDTPVPITFSFPKLEILEVEGPIRILSTFAKMGIRTLKITDSPYFLPKNTLRGYPSLEKLEVKGRNNLHKFDSLPKLRALKFSFCPYKSRGRSKSEDKFDIGFGRPFRSVSVLPPSTKSFTNPEVHLYEISQLTGLEKLKIERKNWGTSDMNRMDSIFKLRKLRDLPNLSILNFQTHLLRAYINILDKIPKKLTVKLVNSSLGFDTTGLGGYPKIRNLRIDNSNFPFEEYAIALKSKHVESLYLEGSVGYVKNMHKELKHIKGQGELKRLIIRKGYDIFSIEKCKNLSFLSLESFPFTCTMNIPSLKNLEAIFHRGGTTSFSNKFKNLERAFIGFGKYCSMGSWSLEDLEHLRYLTLFQHQAYESYSLTHRIDELRLKNLRALRELSVRLQTNLYLENVPEIEYLRMGMWRAEKDMSKYIAEPALLTRYSRYRNYKMTIAEGFRESLGNLKQLLLDYVTVPVEIENLLKFVSKRKNCKQMEYFRFKCFDDRPLLRIEEEYDEETGEIVRVRRKVSRKESCDAIKKVKKIFRRARFRKEIVEKNDEDQKRKNEGKRNARRIMQKQKRLKKVKGKWY